MKPHEAEAHRKLGVAKDSVEAAIALLKADCPACALRRIDESLAEIESAKFSLVFATVIFFNPKLDTKSRKVEQNLNTLEESPTETPTVTHHEFKPNPPNLEVFDFETKTAHLVTARDYDEGAKIVAKSLGLPALERQAVINKGMVYRFAANEEGVRRPGLRVQELDEHEREGKAWEPVFVNAEKLEEIEACDEYANKLNLIFPDGILLDEHGMRRAFAAGFGPVMGWAYGEGLIPRNFLEVIGADLRGAYLTGAYLTGADLRGADLRGADLTGAYLTGADLTGAYLTGADLRGADLRGAYLTGADLRGAYLRGAYLRGAYLRGAYLRGADLTGAYLTGADLRGAYLINTTVGKDWYYGNTIVEGAKGKPKDGAQVLENYGFQLDESTGIWVPKQVTNHG